MAITSLPEHVACAGRSDPGAARTRTGELYARHARMVAWLCRGLLRDRAEAEDAAQQVFLSAHRALLNGSAPREPGPWLAAIARNECLARIRSRMREPLPAPDPDGTAAVADPLAEAIGRADLEALWRAVSELPLRQREALLLRELRGLSYGELAEALSVSRPTVESLLFRARSGLRTRLKGVYAAVGGASWLDGLARLLAGGSGAVAPAAAKALAVGVGAAVVTSGAAVAPNALRRPPRVEPASVAVAHPVVVARRRERPALTPAGAHPVRPARVIFPATPPRHRAATSGRRGDSRGDGAAATGAAARTSGEGDRHGSTPEQSPSSGSGGASSDTGTSSAVAVSGGGSGSSGEGGASATSAAAPTATTSTSDGGSSGSGSSGHGGGGSGSGDSSGHGSGGGGGSVTPEP
ncbi:MAG: hypothetical protein V7644_255 [Actinomycetota bacterium]